MDVIKIIGTPLYQWEVGRKISIDTHNNTIINRVEFSQSGDDVSLVVEPRQEDGTTVADIPNIMLQSGGYIRVYLSYKAENLLETTASSILSVIKRPKPTDYVYTETEVLSYEHLVARISSLEGEGLANAVADYLKENPVEAGATTEQVAQIAQNKQDIENLSNDKLDASKLPEAVNEALAQAKASGEFDGKDGKDGADGQNGYTPVKGVDYFDGADGKDGQDGYTPKKGVDYFDGKDGKDGQDGYTPARGTDYWTSADISEIKSYVDEAILGGAW